MADHEESCLPHRKLDKLIENTKPLKSHTQREMGGRRGDSEFGCKENVMAIWEYQHYKLITLFS